MSEKQNIFEKIGLTFEEANECWERHFVNEIRSFSPTENVLKDVISDDNLSVAQKVYLTWIYASTLESRKEMSQKEEDSW